MMVIAGLGPHGERASAPSQIELAADDVARAREAGFSVAVVLHTLEGDWSKQQVAGIVGTLGDCATAVIEVVDCGFEVNQQIAALDRLIDTHPDAIISLPIGNAAVADAHRRVAQAGIKLMLLDNVPTGLLPGTDYVSLVSADNFGLGEIAAELLSPHIDHAASVGVLAYGVDFFATNEREIAFAKWVSARRPDVSLRTAKFPTIEHAGDATEQLLDVHPELAGLFVVWEAPALGAIATLKARGIELPVTTVDLGEAAALEMAGDGLIKGIGAQQPAFQGKAMAKATILALLGQPTPEWVALPGIAVTRQNVVESFQMVWRAPAPQEIILRCRRSDLNA